MVHVNQVSPRRGSQIKADAKLQDLYESLAIAASDANAVTGLTHDFYRYPARFSPVFARTAIELLSRSGDVVLDPFVGGGTTVVESLALGRHAIGSDCNTLALFLTRVKTTPLSNAEISSLQLWFADLARRLDYRSDRAALAYLLDDERTKNLEHYRSRAIRKAIAIGLHQLQTLPSSKSQDFARCALLKTGQWALDGRKKRTTLDEFRTQLPFVAEDMLQNIDSYKKRVRSQKITTKDRLLIHLKAQDLFLSPAFRDSCRKVDLVVTSPPYPGVHVLYHRWQIDGRRESPAPYWIADCLDGNGASFYTFGDRKRKTGDKYFADLLESFSSIRNVMREGGLVAQLVAFSQPRNQLRRYLACMEAAGFRETGMASGRRQRFWRDVPNRKWHANLNGQSKGAREVLLLHQAI